MDTTIQSSLQSGMTLIRHYNGDYNPDQQCGPVSYYQSLENQLLYQALEYYTPKDSSGWPTGPNKFFKHVVWHIYAPTVSMPPTSLPPGSAWCEPPNAMGEMHIHARYTDPSYDAYKLPACLSHETGHAYHFWCGLYTGNPQPVIQQFWEKEVSSNHTVCGQYAPWQKADGGFEDGREQFANSYRYLFGVSATRGVSGPGTTDPVVPGFEDPANHPEFRKQFRLLPELCGYVRSYGMANLSWQGDATSGYWQFTNNAGTWIAQTDYYVWFEWRNVSGTWKWVQVYPSYVVA